MTNSLPPIFPPPLQNISLPEKPAHGSSPVDQSTHETALEVLERQATDPHPSPASLLDHEWTVSSKPPELDGEAQKLPEPIDGSLDMESFLEFAVDGVQVQVEKKDSVHENEAEKEAFSDGRNILASKKDELQMKEELTDISEEKGVVTEGKLVSEFTISGEQIEALKALAKQKGFSDERISFLMEKVTDILGKFELIKSKEDLNEVLSKLQQELPEEEFEFLVKIVEDKLSECQIAFHFQAVSNDSTCDKVEKDDAKQPSEQKRLISREHRASTEGKTPGIGSFSKNGSKSIREQDKKNEEKAILEKIQEHSKARNAILQKTKQNIQEKRKELTKEIQKDQIKSDEIDLGELMEELKQEEIADDRAELVIKEYKSLVEYFNSTPNLDGLQENILQLKTVLSHKEMMIVLRRIEYKMTAQ